MKEEQGKTLEAIKFAIQMEIDGKKYYQKASRQSDNKVGRELGVYSQAFTTLLERKRTGLKLAYSLGRVPYLILYFPRR
jgi:hypothetical protein